MTTRFSPDFSDPAQHAAFAVAFTAERKSKHARSTAIRAGREAAERVAIARAAGESVPVTATDVVTGNEAARVARRKAFIEQLRADEAAREAVWLAAGGLTCQAPNGVPIAVYTSKRGKVSSAWHADCGARIVPDGQRGRGQRRDALYCSNACRQRADRARRKARR